MRPIHSGRTPLLIAPALALTATLPLMFLTGQPGAVALWGGLATLVAAVPLAVPPHYLRPAVWMCAALVTVLVVITGASIGFFYSPVVLALPLAFFFTRTPAVRPGPRREDPAQNPVRDRH
ncbi:hypothetical protein [Nocardiopsis valliformis]|uniref:hypothetical protein n=1 Tax=Nocardiopsis valliformis TaxID=239974 RepID=UPI00034C55A4|nr:hypothetical protein [Nocardiopsis valliformis]